jgi:copper chaperone
MNQTKLYVSGMSCGGCVNSVQTILSKQLGIDKDDIDVDLDNGTAIITSDEPLSADSDALDEAIFALKRQGFPAQKFEA